MKSKLVIKLNLEAVPSSFGGNVRPEDLGEGLSNYTDELTRFAKSFLNGDEIIQWELIRIEGEGNETRLSQIPAKLVAVPAFDDFDEFFYHRNLDDIDLGFDENYYILNRMYHTCTIWLSKHERFCDSTRENKKCSFPT